MKKISFFSSNRADLAFIYNLFFLFNKNKKYKTSIILNDASNVDYSYIDKKRIIKISNHKINTEKFNLVNHLTKLMKEYNFIMSKKRPDYLFVIGDRYEAFIITIICNFLNIKIIHIAGGDVSKGAYDDEMRTYISKSSSFHFVTNTKSKKNLNNLVNDKKKIFNFGSPSLDYIKKINNLNKKELSNLLNINFNKYNILVTFHPETKNLKETFKNLTNLLESLINLGEDYNFFFTGSNVDTYGQKFNKKILSIVKKKKNFYFFHNLGSKIYIQLAKKCQLVIGNSSSIIYEMPFIGTKSVLIGSRQDGRYMSKKIIKIKPFKRSIFNCIKANINKGKINKDLVTYGNGFASIRIYKKVNNLINEK